MTQNGPLVSTPSLSTPGPAVRAGIQEYSPSYSQLVQLLFNQSSFVSLTLMICNTLYTWLLCFLRRYFAAKRWLLQWWPRQFTQFCIVFFLRSFLLSQGLGWFGFYDAKFWQASKSDLHVGWGAWGVWRLGIWGVGGVGGVGGACGIWRRRNHGPSHQSPAQSLLAK